MKIKSNYAGDLNLNDFYIQAVAKGVGNRIKNAHLQIPRDGIINIKHISNTEFEIGCENIDGQLCIAIIGVVFA